MKPYQQVPIRDRGEPLVPIPLDAFAIVQPHPYEQLGAPYQGRSPYYLRQTVCDRLLQAQQALQAQRSGWKIQIFDAYRPVAVQQFMVEQTYQQLLTAQGLSPSTVSRTQQAAILNQVYEFWAVPSSDPATPPPHSTGAAIDITLTDNQGQAINMGSPIDEPSVRSYPHHFADKAAAQAQQYHQNRQLLAALLTAVGFKQHPQEWWHFSYGDQMWAWQSRSPFAYYGKAT
ncbi:M15 family metallopeptidase [Almyronema epifaneia]|uniref:D-alanyl-D-alanine dipeptidase n=1 Tax=Almyronema epifaneia S1 TaxID=2991925 RepID=A0ABW6IBZ1_9CYAN